MPYRKCSECGHQYNTELEAEFRALAEWLVDVYLWRRANGKIPNAGAIDGESRLGTMRGKVDQ